MWINDTFRGKLLKLVLSLILISLLVVILYGIHYISKKDEINIAIDKINKLNINLIMDIKSQTDFIKYDAVDTNFHIKGISSNLETHKKLTNNINEIIYSFKRNDYYSKLKIKPEIDSLVILLNIMNIEFEKIIKDIELRGFKDFGIEGKMRSYAHRLESTDIDPSFVLSLRRHEKDFIIRKEPQYVEKQNIEGEGLKKFVNTHYSNNKDYRDSINKILINYLREFNKLVAIEEKIGLYNNNGIIQKLERIFYESGIIIEQINNKAYMERKAMFRKLEFNTIWFFAILGIVIILISISMARSITEPLNALTTFITSVTEEKINFTKFPEFNNTDNEIAILVSEFKKMLVQLKLHEKERDIAETAIRENETKYRNLADMLPQSVFETDADCVLTYFNKTLASTFRYDQSSLINKIKITDIIDADCDVFMECENTSGADYSATKLTGEKFPVILYVSKIIKNNTVIGFRGIMVDITEKKQYTEELKEQKLKAEQSDKLKSAFLANMSHEIRTPMNSIVGFSQFLTNPDLDEHTRLEYSDYIRNSSDLLLKIINDILDIAKIESGQLRITYSDFDINSLLNIIEIQANELNKNRKKNLLEIKIIKYFDDKIVYISSDQHRLEQVLINLISNAIKFTEKGSVEIGYRVTANVTIEFFVKDTGIGISSEMQGNIFERFVQAEDVNNKQYEGTGLGLAISKSIIELLNGKIWVESIKGEGSIFYFEIPFISKYSDSNPNNVMIRNIDIDINCFKGKKIVVAEDVEYNFLFLHEGLKHLGMEIQRAWDGAEAVELIKNDAGISLVLMDMRMPVMDGYEASRKIKEINPELPVIAATAYAISGDKEKCLNAGCDYYLPKPIKIETLIQTMGHFLMNKKTYFRVELKQIG